jgi:hypothetical protein
VAGVDRIKNRRRVIDEIRFREERWLVDGYNNDFIVMSLKFMTNISRNESKSFTEERIYSEICKEWNRMQILLIKKK